MSNINIKFRETHTANFLDDNACCYVAQTVQDLMKFWGILRQESAHK